MSRECIDNLCFKHNKIEPFCDEPNCIKTQVSLLDSMGSLTFNVLIKEIFKNRNETGLFKDTPFNSKIYSCETVPLSEIIKMGTSSKKLCSCKHCFKRGYIVKYFDLRQYPSLTWATIITQKNEERIVDPQFNKELHEAMGATLYNKGDDGKPKGEPLGKIPYTIRVKCSCQCIERNVDFFKYSIFHNSGRMEWYLIREMGESEKVGIETNEEGQVIGHDENGVEIGRIQHIKG